MSGGRCREKDWQTHCIVDETKDRRAGEDGLVHEVQHVSEEQDGDESTVDFAEDSGDILEGSWRGRGRHCEFDRLDS